MTSAWRPGAVVDGLYKVVERLGRGGMGVVWRVRHVQWGIDLAVKCPLPEMFDGPADRERFTGEAETWVALGRHPNVCGCFYVRTIDGVPSVFAEYVAGGSLRERIDDGRLYAGPAEWVPARLLDVAIQVARGLDHAHRRGFVHLDVKPANVLIDTDETAKITDFGLARAKAVTTAFDDAAPGRSTLVAGGWMTREYAPPEQAAGRAVGGRADVHALAASIVDMYVGGLTWRTGAAAAAALADCRDNGPSRPGPPPVPDALAELLNRCLDWEPERRPGSMAELAEALIAIHRDVTGEEYARPAPVEAELLADEHNNRALSLLDLGLPRQAEAAFAEALRTDPHHLQAVYNRGLHEWRQGRMTDEDVIAALEAASVNADRAERRRAEDLLVDVHLERGDQAAAGRLLARHVPEPGPGIDTPAWRTDRPRHVHAFRLSGDRRLALTGTYDGPVLVWDVPNGRRLFRLTGHGKDVRALDVTADGRFAVSADRDGGVRLWDLTDGRCVATATGHVADIGIAHDGRRVLWTDPGRALWRWDLGEEPWILAGAADVKAERVALSPASPTALTSGWGARGARVTFWDLGEDPRPPRDLFDGGPSVTAMALSHDGRSAAIASADGRIALWDPAADSPFLTMEAEQVGVLVFTPDGRHLLSGANGKGLVRYWDIATGRCLRSHRVESGAVASIAVGAGKAVTGAGGSDGVPVLRSILLPDGHTAPPSTSRPRRHTELSGLSRQVAVALEDASSAIAAGRLSEALNLLERARSVPGHEYAPAVLRAWRTLGRQVSRTGLRSARTLGSLRGGGEFSAVELSPDGRVAVTAGTDATIRVWDTTTGMLTKVLDGQYGRWAHLGLCGDRVLSASLSGVVRLWSLTTGECLRVLSLNARLPGRSPVRFAHKGSGALAAARDGRLRLWDLGTGELLRTMSGHIGDVTALWVGPDGRTAASAGADETVRVWDLDSGEQLQVLNGHSQAVGSVCLGETVVLSCGTGFDRTVRLWDLRTGAPIREFEEHPGSVEVRLTDDERFAVSNGRDGKTRVWEVASGRCLRTLDGGHGKGGLALSADGCTVLADARIWELDWNLDAGGDGR